MTLLVVFSDWLVGGVVSSVPVVHRYVDRSRTGTLLGRLLESTIEVRWWRVKKTEDRLNMAAIIRRQSHITSQRLLRWGV